MGFFRTHSQLREGSKVNNLTSKLKIWISAARLRTLPLAFSGTGMGNLLAWQNHDFKPAICFLTFITTLFLQVLSNFANDLGDSLHGADHAGRKGPGRAVQSGKISAREMKMAVLVTALGAFLSGICLLFLSFSSDWADALPLFATGLLSIGAAYFYTNGKKPYGYMALGDVSVFVFFGLVAVSCSYYLHTHTFTNELILPSCAFGFLSTAVLNINNMRDTESDLEAGKITLPIVLGPQKSIFYHSLLVFGGIACLIISVFNGRFADILFLVPGIALILKSYFGVLKSRTPESMDQYLKPQALGVFLSMTGLWASVLFSSLIF